jgi:D-glycero-alpha-D-manno-heptose 1-phosphate guanylyltransferase
VTLPCAAEAVVLAGGLGTRLRPVVSDVPKPLAPIAGRPFLHWLLDGLARQGIARVVLATGYMAGSIRDAVGATHAGIEVLHAPEPAPLGTGGAIWAALGHCAGERVFVLNGDTWLGAALAPITAEAPRADIVMAVRPVADRSRYGSVRVEGGRVVGMTPKGLTGPGLVNAGLYLMRRDLPARRPIAGAFSFENEVLAAPGDLDIRAHRSDAPFIDIGTPEDFTLAQAVVPEWAGAGR